MGNTGKKNYLKDKDCRLIGPNCSRGLYSRGGKAFKSGNYCQVFIHQPGTIGIVSRSGTLLLTESG